MKTIILGFAFVLLASCSLFNSQKPDEGLKSRFLEAIDPDAKMFGVAYGASEDEILSILGPPDATLAYARKVKGLVYHDDIAFVLHDDRFVALVISDMSIHNRIWDTFFSATPHPPYVWRLSDGIAREMNQKEIRGLLGKNVKLVESQYLWKWTTKKSEVEIDFAHLVKKGEGDESFIAYNLVVKKKGEIGRRR
jgi:hypothetical protein